VSIPGIPNDSDIPLFGGSQLAREHAIEDGETPVGAALTVIYIYTNKVGNRDMMIREEEDCRRTTVYSYDANDRLDRLGDHHHRPDAVRLLDAADCTEAPPSTEPRL
jgi:hypothetical protein